MVGLPRWRMALAQSRGREKEIKIIMEQNKKATANRQKLNIKRSNIREVTILSQKGGQGCITPGSTHVIFKSHFPICSLQTDGLTDEQTDGRKYPLKESLGRN